MLSIRSRLRFAPEPAVSVSESWLLFLESKEDFDGAEALMSDRKGNQQQSSEILDHYASIPTFGV